jgi:hypothetical protein
MNYWITTHWPPRVDDDESITETGVWLAEGRQQAAHDMCPGDYVPTNTRGGGHKHGGGEGAVHLNLKNYVNSNPAVALNEPGLRSLGVEYEFPTNGRADVVLVDQHNRIVGVEIEPSVDDLLRHRRPSGAQRKWSAPKN